MRAHTVLLYLTLFAVLVLNPGDFKSLLSQPALRATDGLGKFRVFYEVNEPAEMVSIVSVGHKVHNVLLIRGKEVQL